MKHRPWRHRLVTWHRTAAFILLNTLILLVLLELGLGAFRWALRITGADFLLGREKGRSEKLVDHYSSLSYYAHADWSRRYWDEHWRSLAQTYHPYVIWRGAPFDGTLIGIDAEGLRLTPGSAPCRSPAYRVFVYGGSTVWGWGSPDWGTIPSYLLERLTSRLQRPVCVVNYGQNAYVSTQSLIQLQRSLAAGDIPDLVVFYDGVNEVLAADQSGRPGLHQNLEHVAARLERRNEAWPSVIRDLSLFWLADRIRNGIFPNRQRDAVGQPTDQSELAEGIVRTYLANYRTASALSREFQFDFVFVWQPFILEGNKPLADEERVLPENLEWVLRLKGPLASLFSKTYARLALEAAGEDRLILLTHVFDSMSESLWIDTWGHLTPEGNRLMAGEIDRTIEGLFQSPQTADGLR